MFSKVLLFLRYPVTKMLFVSKYLHIRTTMTGPSEH